MIVRKLELPGLLLIEPRVFDDSRGYFLETYQSARYAEAGLPDRFVQDNLSRSRHGTLRGLHFQRRFPQGKLVQVTQGAVYDVAVDLRHDSPAFGRWAGVVISDDNHYQLYLPPGFAHGFCVLSEVADFHYKCTDYYRPDDEGGVLWCDARLGIEWPVADPMVSDKDRAFPTLSELSPTLLPTVPDRS